MTEVKLGDIVDFTVRGVRAASVNTMSGRVITIADEHGTKYPVPPQAAVTHVAPAEWPPRPRDVWGTHDGNRWFAARYMADPDDPKDFEGCNSEGWRLVLIHLDVGPYGDAREGRPDEVRAQAGRMFLVHREDGGE